MAVLNTTSPWPSASAPSARPTNDRPSSRTRAAYFLAGNDHRLVETVLLGHEHGHLAVDVGHVRLESVRGLAQMAVVAVLAGVDRANRDRMPFELLQLAGQPPRQVIAS